MHTFKVWAPVADDVAVHIGEASYPLTQRDGGWWSGDVQQAGPGTDYRFVIDGGKPLPDPRSGWQPFGIDGPSRVVEHSGFEWTDPNWQARPLAGAIIYELHVGTFTPAGTFKAAIECLDHLVELGITHVQLMPVNEFSGDWGWGYDGVDLYAPHHAYGSPNDLKALVDACHAKRLAVLLDVVYNHFGPAGNYVGEFGPYFTKAYNTPWGPAVNLDRAGSHEVRRFFAENARMWLRDYHFDGLRLDAVHALVDRSAIHFLEYLSSEVDALAAQLGRNLVLIAESDLNDPRIVTSREANGYGIDAQWSDDFHHALHAVLTGERNGYYQDFGSLAQLAKALQQGYVYDGRYSRHRERIHGRAGSRLSGHHFLGYAQTHDQVGNRAQGERLSQLVSVGLQKIAAALVMTSPFVPMLFQGEEFGASTPFQYFTQHKDPELAKQVSEGRRGEFKTFGWNPEQVPDPQDPATFQRSKLRWREMYEEPHASLLRWYKDLIALRRSRAGLTDGRMDRVEVNFDERASWLSVRREDVEVVCNLASDRQAIPVRCPKQPVLASEDGWQLRPGLLELAAESVAILAN
ncbi:MAG TPA: malto-oligosyltrehalose trehalohydrolase [Bryobacteraceae bacterium]|nr:malto-oligosyltrehalose trehalohydrolase [Bryobacteraceae bacterium]HTW67817.1 malto-oligosyltrehalose trehalohydrolase [Bryobacteraceae bacterium]